VEVLSIIAKVKNAKRVILYPTCINGLTQIPININYQCTNIQLTNCVHQQLFISPINRQPKEWKENLNSENYPIFFYFEKMKYWVL
jgi:hypothetical protein